MIIVRDLVLKVIGFSVTTIGFMLTFITGQYIAVYYVFVGFLITIIGCWEV